MLGLRRGLCWLRDNLTAKVQHLILRIIAAGPVPRHVAFIMDGNRRYARQRHQKVQQGHVAGFGALRRMLEICLRMNVNCVTVYAFALDNFHRPAEEVDALMVLAADKLVEMCKHGDLLTEYGVRLNVLGRKELFPEFVRTAIDKAEKLTSHNNRAILNICMAYSSRDEITTAVESCVRLAVNAGSPPKISVQDIDSQLMTSLVGSPPVDVLVRSSGVNRLSDFLLWQICENTQIHFSTAYWPDFGFFDFIPIVLNFQRKLWSEGKIQKLT